MIPFSREAHLDELSKREFDLLVIGGGITGAGIAREAAMRGLSVGLLEARDFCSGTSSKSSKLLHGGIRYLEQFQLSLVFEASRERRLHSELLSPHLAAPVPFLIPVYPWSPHGMLAVSAGVFLYDALALFRNHGTRVLSKEKVLKEEDRLEPKGLKGGVIYHDVVMDDARIGFENIRSAAHHGAITVNYTYVRGFDRDSVGKIRGVWVKDAMAPNRSDFRVRAKAFVNASGPWSDYIRRLADPDAESMLRPTKGVHIILPNDVLGRKNAFVLTAKADNRVFFSIPWFDRTLVGTTDTDYDPETDGPLEKIQANQNDLDYLMEGVKRTFPASQVGMGQVISSFAGLRPLVSEGKSNDPSAVSREHRIWLENSGLFTIAGGKYTTYRTMAVEMVDFLVEKVGAEFSWSLPPSTSHQEALVFSDASWAKNVSPLLEEYTNCLGHEVVAHLQRRYGARWQRVADLSLQDRALRERILSTEPDILAEVVYAKQFEMAVGFEDFLRRRTMLALKCPLVKHMDRLQAAAQLFGHGNLHRDEVAGWQGLV